MKNFFPFFLLLLIALIIIPVSVFSLDLDTEPEEETEPVTQTEPEPEPEPEPEEITDPLIFEFTNSDLPDIIKMSAGEIIIILQIGLFYLTFLTFGLIYFLWGGKINRTGSNPYVMNSEEGKKTYYD